MDGADDNSKLSKLTSSLSDLITLSLSFGISVITGSCSLSLFFNLTTGGGISVSTVW